MFTRKEDLKDVNPYAPQPQGYNTPAEEPPVSASSIKNMSVILNGTRIQGDVESECDIRIDGEVKGTILSNARVVVGQSGFIDGDVHCVHAEIFGHIKGSLTVQEHLNLKGKARIEGDVLTTHLEMEPSVMFNGKCTMQEKVELPALSGKKEGRPAVPPASVLKNNLTEQDHRGTKEEKAPGLVSGRQAER